MQGIKKILIITSDLNLREVLSFCFDGWGYEVTLWDNPTEDISTIKRVSPDVIVVDIHSADKQNLDFCRLVKRDFVTACIPLITLINKRQLRMHLLNLEQGVDDYLIKPPDPLDLNVRIEMALRRCQHSFHASPLTGLPGGRIIEDVLIERFNSDKPFSFGYMDIDNFKYFNDVYGYLKGDRVIMHTAYMLYTVIRNFGNKNDFVGHIGGDDFVFITTPDKFQFICQEFIDMFDRVVPFHYFKNDRDHGYIVARDRNRKQRRINLMSISIAVVNKIKNDEFDSMLKINERIAEIKKYLKTIEGSKFMSDRRNTKIKSAFKYPYVNERQHHLYSAYKPLGQILLDDNVISKDQLDNALKTHWKRGVCLGEVLTEMGYVKPKELDLILHKQQASGSSKASIN